MQFRHIDIFPGCLAWRTAITRNKKKIVVNFLGKYEVKMDLAMLELNRYRTLQRVKKKLKAMVFWLRLLVRVRKARMLREKQSLQFEIQEGNEDNV